MAETWDETFAAKIETAVRTVPGVSSVFRDSGLVSRAFRQGRRMLTGHEPSPVRVDRGPDGVELTVAIGVHSASGAVATVDRVLSLIIGLCEAEAVKVVTARVTVVHIEEPPA